MPIGESLIAALGEFIGYFLIEILFRGIILGIRRLLGSLYYGLRKWITGKERPPKGDFK